MTISNQIVSNNMYGNNADFSPAVATSAAGPVQVVTQGLALPYYDYVSVAYPAVDTETYTFKVGGSGGTTVNTVTIVYTTSSKEFISTVTKT